MKTKVRNEFDKAILEWIHVFGSVFSNGPREAQRVIAGTIDRLGMNVYNGGII